MTHLPTLRQLQYLIALDDHRSFNRAAENCAVTQSTLSGGIRDLEDILQSPVIDRTARRHVRLTPLGSEMVRDARDIVARAQALTYRARAMGQPLSWPLRLGVIPTIAPYLLPRLLGPLQKALPRLELHIHEMRSAQLVEQLHGGLLDCALLALPFDIGDLSHKILFHENFVCAAPPGAFPGRKKIAMADLADQKLLLLEDGHCLRDHALAACRLQPVQETRALRATSLSTLIYLVHQGYGLTLLPDMAVDDSLPRGLRLLSFSSGAPRRDIGLVWKPGSFRVPDIKLLLKEVVRLLK